MFFGADGEKLGFLRPIASVDDVAQMMKVKVFTDTGRGDDCLEKYVDLLADAAQNHPLGATWSYCNSGYSLVGRLIEKVTGLTWDEAMRERAMLD